MKITITPFDPKVPLSCSVSIETPHENPTADEAMILCAKALVAYGYHYENIASTLDPETEALMRQAADILVDNRDKICNK